MKPEMMAEMEAQFEIKRKLAAAKDRELFGVFDEPLTDEETLALKFLYAYMPLSDMANYDGALFLNHVRETLRIRSLVPWSDQVPDELYYYFILPYRVNNENIEDVRRLLFDEIYPRVQNLTLAEAVLETNHWCHEKANYIGNDIRTVSPLTLMRTALGRCGEQSSLAVAALRSIGIPARQVYTPRWAHCDSNHAWVEAWTGSDWHFIGACEPEPELDMGWFRQPARRAMLVHTRVPSRYVGEEKTTFTKSWISELNLLDRYSPGRQVTVRVEDASGRPAAARVDFQVYNYGELSTIVTLDTGENGVVSLELGLGDVWIHACGKEGMGFAKLSVASGDSLVLTLSHQLPEGVMQTDMAPPAELPDPQGAVDPARAAANQQRIKDGARIRAEYEATFLQQQDAESLAAALSLPADRVWDVLRHARGNSHEIAAFLQEQCPAFGELPLLLLESMREKDMTDTFRPTLEDHLHHSLPLRDKQNDALFVEYVMCPRLHFEMLEPYRAFFQSELSAEQQARFKANPALLASWIAEWYVIDETYVYYKGMASPAGNYKLKVGDRLSRAILFAAIARSIGVPARLEPSDQRPQYWLREEWHNADFGDSSVAADTAGQETGWVRLANDPANKEQPGYCEHYTLARLDGGVYKTLSYTFGTKDLFGKPLEAVPGHYRLTTGSRLPDGTSLLHISYFNVQPGQTTEAVVTLRHAASELSNLGKLNPDLVLEGLDGAATKLSDAVTGTVARSAVLAWIAPDREPSKHLIRELGEQAAELNEAGTPIYLLIGEDKRSIPLPDATLLPGTISFIKDDESYSALASLVSSMPNTDAGPGNLPVAAIVDAELSIRYFTAGYKLGIVREMLGALKEL